jgi:hypothetical protein
MQDRAAQARLCDQRQPFNAWPCRECPFNRLGEFSAEQPNDLPLSPTAEAFYRSGPTFWQQYTSFWLTSLLNRIVFFIIPVVAALIPVIGFAPRFYRWLRVRRAPGPRKRRTRTCSERRQVPIRRVSDANRRNRICRADAQGCTPHSKSICSACGSIRAWCKKTLVESER